MHQIQRMMSDELVRLGIWRGEERQRQAYVLSPSSYRVDKKRFEELGKLAKAVSRACRGLVAMEKSFRAKAPHCHVGRGILSTMDDAHHGLPKAHMWDEDMPRLMKVDVVESEKGYAIAEIDGYNPRGLPYPPLLEHLYRGAVDSKADFYPGTVEPVSRNQSRMSQYRGGDKCLTILFGDRERFYRPSMAYFVECLKQLGTPAKLFVESEAKPEDISPTVLTFPRMDRNLALRTHMETSYDKDRMRFHHPLRPYLSSKAMLALLSNTAREPELEMFLAQYVGDENLRMVRAFLPETISVSKKTRDVCRNALTNGRWVLKTANGSGMKGVHFSDEVAFPAQLDMALGMKRPQAVLQEEVVQRQEEHPFFTDAGEERTGARYLRICAYIDTRSETIADLDITGRQVKQVHGAKDCIQIPAVLV